MQLLTILLAGSILQLVATYNATKNCQINYCCQVQQLLNRIHFNCSLSSKCRNLCPIEVCNPNECNLSQKYITQLINEAQIKKCKIYEDLCEQIQMCETNYVISFSVLVGLGLLFAIFPCTYQYFYCHCLKEVARLKQRQNVIDTTGIQIQEYNRLKNYVVNLLNDPNSRFQYWSAGQPYNVRIEVRVLKSQPFKTKLYIEGTDILGDWTAEGYIISRTQGVVFWMYKQYNNKKKADQVGKKKHLIFESSAVIIGRPLFGYWYYVGLEKNQKYNGHWKVEPDKQFVSLNRQNV